MTERLRSISPTHHSPPSMDRRSSPARLLRRTPSDEWSDIVPDLEERLSLTADRRVLRLWALVLNARRVPNRPDYGVSRRGSWLGRYGDEASSAHPALYVPMRHKDHALDEIEQYVRENTGLAGPADVPRPPARAGLGQTLLVVFALALFHALVVRTSSSGPVDWSQLGQGAEGLSIAWREAGVSDCFRIRVVGEWWRSVTALTLHADAGHLLTNCLFGGLFFYLVTRRVGSAFGWWAILLSGIVGNMINCRVEGYDHVSLGASTAVLGAVGVLAGIGAGQAGLGMLESSGSRESVWLRAWRGVLLPLAFLGAGEGNVDLGAHLFGFLSGILPGAAAGVLAQLGRTPSRFWDALTALSALGLVVLCWAIALQ
ncbi:MAG: rhomboid family intramembrane serine protease [Oceanidesulfovibrio sp.]